MRKTYWTDLNDAQRRMMRYLVHVGPEAELHQSKVALSLVTEGYLENVKGKIRVFKLTKLGELFLDENYR